MIYDVGDEMPQIELTDIRMHYELSGSGEAVLLLPGLGQTARVWDPIVPILAEHFSVIQIDNRGIGQSVQKRAARRLDDYVADCVELLDALQVNRAHVVGMSFGGVLAQRFAADHPQRVDRLVLISTTGHSSIYLRHMALLLGQALRHFPLRMFYQTIELLGTSPVHYDAHEADIEDMLTQRVTTRVTRRVLANQLRCLVSTTSARNGRPITAPTLVLAGEYDSLIPNCYGKQLAAELADGKFVLIEGCGHSPVAECPQVCGEAICGFLDASKQAPDDRLKLVVN
jgi:pimeloyl-ACP methyl ester carboxylesterase